MVSKLGLTKDHGFETCLYNLNISSSFMHLKVGIRCTNVPIFACISHFAFKIFLGPKISMMFIFIAQTCPYQSLKKVTDGQTLVKIHVKILVKHFTRVRVFSLVMTFFLM